MKYKLIRDILKNGDICELKTWDGKIIFGLYMDNHLYRDQENNVVVQCGGFEEQITAIRRPQSLRNAFDCFKNADLYNYDFNKYGSFDTVYSE